MHTSGYRTLSHEVGDMNLQKANRLESALQKLFLASTDEMDQFQLLNKEYRQYKENYMKHIQYDPEAEGHGMSYIFLSSLYLIFPASPIEHAPLEAVYIMFDTATYDEIERDEKVKVKSWYWLG